MNRSPFKLGRVSEPEKRRRRRRLSLAWRNYRRHCEQAVRAVEAGDVLLACKHTIKADEWYLRHDALLTGRAAVANAKEARQ
jgi:hypothetical protein